LAGGLARLRWQATHLRSFPSSATGDKEALEMAKKAHRKADREAKKKKK
jgi:hypothetical protein